MRTPNRSIDHADLLQRVDALLDACARVPEGVDPAELDEVLTTGCAEALRLGAAPHGRLSSTERRVLRALRKRLPVLRHATELVARSRP